MAFLDETGLTYFWGKIKGWVNNSQHPIGSIYISTSSTFNPQDAWGGTWKRIADGRCLIGASTSYPLGSTGGEATHALSVAELPKHTISIYDQETTDPNASLCPTSFSGGFGISLAFSRAKAGKRYWWSTTMPIGENKEHNNMQPYLAVYFWERTA